MPETARGSSVPCWAYPNGGTWTTIWDEAEGTTAGQSGIVHVMLVLVCAVTAQVRPPQTVTVGGAAPCMNPLPVSTRDWFAARRSSDASDSEGVRAAETAKEQGSSLPEVESDAGSMYTFAIPPGTSPAGGGGGADGGAAGCGAEGGVIDGGESGGGDGAGVLLPHICAPSIGSSAEQVALQDESVVAASAAGIERSFRQMHKSPAAAKPVAACAYVWQCSAQRSSEKPLSKLIAAPYARPA